MYRVKIAAPLHVGKSLEKIASLSMFRLEYLIMKIRVPITIIVAPTPSPNRK